ncbi:uncharacterized protein LOC113279897 [Papaver somniferum]|uniref:uncharacterized protein LOC113279897 n=1 Tax=Papaver somniferum TaxID=3469 RepID=UPI000E6F9176|nr:uncharacterized protein LOC113279897 [Papaver somniferum]
MDVVDVAFIQPIEHRPEPNFIVEAVESPLIDLSPLLHPDELTEAKPVEVALKKFFGLPSEEKRKVQRDEANPLGYYDIEYTKNIRDWKEVFDFMVKDPTTIPAY